MKQFKAYSNFYDTLYQDKNYPKEVEAIISIIKTHSPHSVKTILSLGCGTCNHDILLAQQGFKITGVDQSPTMLKIAQSKINKQDLTNQINLINSNIKNLKVPNTSFDFAMAMFNILGYQISNQDALSFFKNTSQLLKPKGLFVFDCWYAPAVLSDPPTDRVKEFNQDNQRVIRTTKSHLDHLQNLIKIDFHVLSLKDQELTAETKETHQMRYWSLPEIKFLLELAGLELVGATPFLKPKNKISQDTWDIMITAQKLS